MSEQTDKLYAQIKLQAEAGDYPLNPDLEDVRMLVAGLAQNLQRYGYLACPCRLAAGEKAADLDIICPCDYRDDDLKEYGACYCGLYVDHKVARGEQQVQSIPERRPPEGRKATDLRDNVGTLPYPVYRCRVCGYLCARNDPPEVCPICKAGAERFERFL